MSKIDIYIYTKNTKYKKLHIATELSDTYGTANNNLLRVGYQWRQSEFPPLSWACWVRMEMPMMAIDVWSCII